MSIPYIIPAMIVIIFVLWLAWFVPLGLWIAALATGVRVPNLRRPRRNASAPCSP